VNNIKMELRDVGWGGMDRIHLAEDRNMLSALRTRNEPSVSIKFREILE
jgi:hypothetical protein